MNLVERAGKERTQGSKRIVQYFKPGSSTAVPSNVTYRLGKIRKLGVLKGKWLDCGCADGGYTVALVDSGADGRYRCTQPYARYFCWMSTLHRAFSRPV